MPFTRPTANSVRSDAGGRLLRTDNKCRAEHYWTWMEHLKAVRAEQAVEHARKMDRSGLIRSDRPNRVKDDDESDD